MNATPDPAVRPDHRFEGVLTYIKETRGFDFTGYKRTSPRRRIRHRMSQVGIDDYTEYVDHLQVNAEEFAALFNTILINVTGVLPGRRRVGRGAREGGTGRARRAGPGDHLRIWSAGCASGQEA